MVRKKSDTIESLRELISVPPEIEARLRAYARLNPIAGREIEASLRFRKRVLEEFEALALGGCTKPLGRLKCAKNPVGVAAASC
jgi:hypothetical protein